MVPACSSVRGLLALTLLVALPAQAALRFVLLAGRRRAPSPARDG